MASSIWIQGGDGVITYISGSGASQTVYAGSGTPWTSQSTTPYEIGNNDVSGGPWTAIAAPQVAALSGGAPFTIGSRLVGSGFDYVTEEIPIQMRGTTHDNCVALKHRLWRICNTAFGLPAQLAYQPNGATGVVYYPIYAADIQEHAYFINNEDGRKIMRATLRLTRGAIGTSGSLSTVLNGITVTNVGTGANNNSRQLSALSGELLSSHGAPMNIKIVPSGTGAFRKLWMASGIDRIYTSINTAKTTTTSADYVSGGTAVQTGGRLLYGVKIRVVARFTTFTNLSKARFTCTIRDRNGASGKLLKTFPQQTPLNATASFIDFGYFDISAYRKAIAIEPTFNFVFRLDSSDGTSVTATLDYFEILPYYDFCIIEEISNGAVASEYLYLEQAHNAIAGGAYTYAPRPSFYDRRVSDDTPIYERLMRGRPPRAREPNPGTSGYLWMSWTDTSDQHVKTDTATVTAQALPLYLTLRGGG